MRRTTVWLSMGLLGLVLPAITACRGDGETDPDFRQTLIARLPGSFRPMLATRDEVWGMEQDELDVPYIVAYTIRPARAGEAGP